MMVEFEDRTDEGRRAFLRHLAGEPWAGRPEWGAIAFCLGWLLAAAAALLGVFR